MRQSWGWAGLGRAIPPGQTVEATEFGIALLHHLFQSLPSLASLVGFEPLAFDWLRRSNVVVAFGLHRDQGQG